MCIENARWHNPRLTNKQILNRVTNADLRDVEWFLNNYTTTASLESTRVFPSQAKQTRRTSPQNPLQAPRALASSPLSRLKRRSSRYFNSHPRYMQYNTNYSGLCLRDHREADGVHVTSPSFDDSRILKHDSRQCRSHQSHRIYSGLCLRERAAVPFSKRGPIYIAQR